MALQLDYTIPNTTIVVPGAYWRIENIRGGKLGFYLLLRIYTSQIDYDNGDLGIGTDSFNFMPDVDSAGYLIDTEVDSSGFATHIALNFIAQGYEHLKSLNEFLLSTDV